MKEKQILKAFIIVLVCILTTTMLIPEAFAQKRVDFDESLYSSLEYRNIGPFRGGRSAAVAGVAGNPVTFYFGGTGGGVWKTTNGGQSWKNVSDGFFGGSIGAVAVSEWDPNVIYVGGGEKTVRGNVSHGYGMWKSSDAGKTWKQIGLEDSHRIPRIRIHPKNPDLVYAAVLGHLSGPNEQRGVYRSKDGGTNWERILFVSNEVGSFDLMMDPSNPRILFATMWRLLRTPYSLESGGEGSSIWKSTDGGNNWTDITHNEGLPKGMIGISGVTVSPVNSNRVWVIVEAKDGGVFRSEDGGEKWAKINSERKLRQRAWYYTRIYADPMNQDIVYVLNVRFWRSKDGGKTYESIRTPHGDHHDLWIAPDDGNRMVVGDDGGAQVSYDAGAGWSTYNNQPTAQFYRVTTDNSFPYKIYGAQQDNSTVRIVHRSGGGSIGERDWEPTAGGESGWIAPHPENPDIVYGGSYGGSLTRVNHKTGERRRVNVWPDNPMGHGAEDWKYRFQWNFPILFSPHDPNTLYAAGNVLFKTTNEGQSWQAISPDLTINDKSKLGSSGGPITQDNTSVEYYATIFTVVESPLEAGVIWTGSDDGLIHVTRDGGENWENVTPKKNFPEWMQVNSIEANPFEKGGLYVAGTRYKSDDFTPYLYKTTDYGKSWKKITKGIDPLHFTRVIRADPVRQGLLFAGTESGMYLSFDDGTSWKSFQLELPVVPITDLAIKNNDLIVATQGRAFWVLDNLTVLHQLSDQVAQSNSWLYEPRESYRMSGGFRRGGGGAVGQNPPSGVVFNYYFEDLPDSSSVKFKILESDGTLITSYSPKAKETNKRLPLEVGANRFAWNTRYPDAEKFPKLIMWAGSVTGPRAVPGSYQARLVVGEDSTTVPFEILKDPRSSSTQEDIQSQFDFLIAVRDKLTEAHVAIKQIRDVRSQVKAVTKRAKEYEGAKQIQEAGKALTKKMTTIEEALYQTKNQSRQDPLNFPIRLNNKLAAVGGTASVGDYPPTEQIIAVKNELTAQIDEELAKFSAVMREDIPAFNQLVRDASIPAVQIDMKERAKTQASN